MRLKEILTENSGYEAEAKKLHGLLQDKYTGPKNPLYRGYSEDVDTFKVKNIRKNRRPSDTPRYLQRLVDEMAEDYDALEIPKRRESKFASTSRSFAASFGQPYICFPEKDANIVSSKYDTWEQTLARVHSHFKKSINLYERKDWKKETIKERYPDLARAIQLLKDAKEEDSLERKFGLVEKLWNFFDENREEIQRQGELSGIEELLSAFSLIEVHYLDTFDKSIGKNDEEVMFDGDTYLLVDPEFFDRYFEWDRMYGKWKIKSKYR